ncbi:hypothetical protein GGR51DRAFT_546741 [Nemania sp. FL0031]|nr:hypothetical protein GGR51DRAFT_546741 [Nemania sp. FL0031]
MPAMVSAAPTHHVDHANIDPTAQPVLPLPAAATDTDGEDHPNGNTFSTKSRTHSNSSSKKPAPPTAQSDNDNDDAHDNERPAKRRRVRDTTPQRPIRRPKVESPPWKKIEADGPTTFIEDGKRRSARTNALPMQLQPPSTKRMTRDRRASATTSVHGTQRNASTPRPPPAKAPSSATRSSSRKSLNSAPKPLPKTRTASTPSRPSVETPKHSLPTRRSSRTRRDSMDTPTQVSEPPVIKVPTVPIVHPAQVHVLPGQTIAPPKIASTFEEYIARAPTLDVREGGWLDFTDDGPPYTQEIAEKDAQVILRIEKEVEPGGLLSEGRSSLFAPDPVEEPPRQWAHMDHLVKQMANFRKLMIAEACRDEWLSPEARTECIARYKTVIKALQGTWDNVKTEINQQKRVKAALNEAVSMSELKLQARRAHVDSDDQDLENFDDEEGGDEMDVDSEDADPDVDATNEDEDEDDQLRQKYANIPDIPAPELEENDARGDMYTDDPAETTDESIDMDDDMTSSDDNMDSAEEDDSIDEDDGDDSDDDAEESAGLLGLFFGKKELKKLKEDASIEDRQPMISSVAAKEVRDLATDDAGIDARQPITNENMGPEHPATGLDAQTTTNAPTRDEYSAEPSKLILTYNDVLVTKTALPATTVDSPAGNKPDTRSIIPSTLEPPDIEMGEADVGHVTENSPQGEAGIAYKQPTAAVSSIEASHTLPDGQLPSSETDAVTSSISRDRSQSPRTSDTKPSEVDTASSVTKSGVSRSTTPPSQSPKTEVPFLLRGTLREYQHYGLDWLAGLYKNQTNGILADEMGLAHLACHHEIWGPHLVIVPTSVMLNWEMEFKKWCPGFKVLSYYGSIDERKRKRQGWKTDDMWNVCITSYQIVLQDQQVFKRRQWHYMILDEAHNIKNFKSKRWQTLLGFNTQARLLLTGTPLQNNLTELWSLLFFLMPSENGIGGFADLAEFQDWFHKPESQILESGREQMDDEARAIIAKLHKVLRPYLLRRLKADVEKQMPAKYEHVELCRLSRRQRELYDGFLARTDTREALASGNYISVINCLMQLRKVCNHPDLFVERPIMTSFRQPRSVVANFAVTETLVRKKFLTDPSSSTVNLGFLNLIPRQLESLSATVCDRVSKLTSDTTLLEFQQTQEARALAAKTDFDPSTVESNIAYLDSIGRWGRLEELRHCVYINRFRRQQRPIYGQQLTKFLTLGVEQRPFKSRPRVPQKIMSWFEEDSPVLRSIVPTLDQRAASMRATISKFACITPAVVTRDLDEFVLGSRQIELFEDANLTLSAPIRYAPFMSKESPLDPWHESRMKLSIQFPDKRLLQYDCGKLQVLDKLLRKLQAGGHRALIFTQMTKVLDVLEQFLNIHGHKYLRLDGATKVEQRQILTDRFNHDPRILCFILSTRSGGLGINLTGADTVIFYDQDWNPAMDKQCQDRCHRIGQTRDVHIYRLVSEHTIEANILRKASQKQMLDDIVIQEGGFTTDYFNKLSVRDVMSSATDEADVVGDAMDRVLGGVESADQRTVGRVLEQAEDREDVAAAHVAEKEIQEDEADFAEKPVTATASGASTTRQGTPITQDGHGVGRSNPGLFSTLADVDEATPEIENNAWGERMSTIDDYMLAAMSKQLEGAVLEFPKDKKKSKSKKGKDTRKR